MTVDAQLQMEKKQDIVKIIKKHLTEELVREFKKELQSRAKLRIYNK